MEQDQSDQDLMEGPADWTSIAEQYGPEVNMMVFFFAITSINYSRTHF